MLLCRNNRAITDGLFYDLQYANYTRAHGYNCDKQYAFMRKDPGGKTLLVVANFDRTPVHVGVCIPQHAFDFLKLRRGLFSCRSLLTGKPGTIDLKPDMPVYIEVPELGATVLEW